MKLTKCSNLLSSSSRAIPRSFENSFSSDSETDPFDLRPIPPTLFLRLLRYHANSVWGWPVFGFIPESTITVTSVALGGQGLGAAAGGDYVGAGEGPATVRGRYIRQIQRQETGPSFGGWVSSM